MAGSRHANLHSVSPFCSKLKKWVGTGLQAIQIETKLFETQVSNNPDRIQDCIAHLPPEGIPCSCLSETKQERKVAWLPLLQIAL